MCTIKPCTAFFYVTIVTVLSKRGQTTCMEKSKNMLPAVCKSFFHQEKEYFPTGGTQIFGY